MDLIHWFCILHVIVFVIRLFSLDESVAPKYYCNLNNRILKFTWNLFLRLSFILPRISASRADNFIDNLVAIVQEISPQPYGL